MKKTIVLGSFAAALLFAPLVHAQQPAQAPSAGSGTAQFCLKKKEGGTINCIYQTMAQCQQASNAGKEGDCTTNPKATTGAGAPMQKQ
jgi:hypothetical protein